MAYAETTSVPFEKSIAEIIGLLKRSGAEQIGQMEDRQSFTLTFAMQERIVKFRVVFPSSEEIAKMTGPRQEAAKVRDQWHRQRGRALLLVLKAKLESIESRVETFEQAFLANVVMANGETVYERISAPIALEYKTTKPQMLLESPR